MPMHSQKKTAKKRKCKYVSKICTKCIKQNLLLQNVHTAQLFVRRPVISTTKKNSKIIYQKICKYVSTIYNVHSCEREGSRPS